MLIDQDERSLQCVASQRRSKVVRLCGLCQRSTSSSYRGITSLMVAMKLSLRLLPFGVALLAFVGARAQADSILYDNGPIVGDDGRNIGNYRVSDSFTLASDSNLTQVQIG